MKSNKKKRHQWQLLNLLKQQEQKKRKDQYRQHDEQILEKVQQKKQKQLLDITEKVCESGVTCPCCGIHFVRAC